MEFNNVQDSGTRRSFDTGAVRDAQEGKGRFDLLPVHAITRLAKHFENGAKKYGDENWRKGIPVRVYLDSALRHLFKLLGRENSEDHAAASIWNLCCFIETLELIDRGILPKELDNRPKSIYEAEVENGRTESNKESNS
jgi:hypothetical protein